ncbi:MAG TPA: transcription termination factor Rho [Candidatus Bipolaricaulis anaerobius]|jgi:transcription termination factor Rho|uniref:Transcription termination factor Rho n=2 Tax=Candidatus Bipolaricaulis anaerobius TaxID=2026885 RepID=A0A2X3K6A9_9BACT|nr:transcription termination factor Rho [Candidatus Bipolaricaulis sp.]SQD92767.1 transcription termination factor [Candidatus Bipolaricaulis anaerobius]HNR24019.1 transcription termination factor Rho [Candidatus Bipolaricaulis anaerobius]HNS23898.1 transcription termination factor Rho [Candidatus Bipolaricaulis anaerobius]HQM37862.1 transcription termination factor Rho [Candidatus Bipolaricaulis anaerobius]
MEMSEVRSLGLEKLTGLAQSLGVDGTGDLSSVELELAVMRALAERQELVVEGILEIMPDGYGFLRERSCLPSRYDVYVSPSQIKRFGLKDGDLIRGPVRQPREGERYFALLKLDQVSGLDPEQVRKRVDFQQLTPLHPNEHLVLEHDPDEPSTRMIDLFAPIGKGQRGLIVSPPKAGKTTLLKHIAHGIEANHPDVRLLILLVDERPEEVTDFRRSVKKAEVIAATFDMEPQHHTRIAELATAEGKRLVESGYDVVILMDSLTRLGRAYNLSISPSGKLLSGGIDPTALYKPKEFFGAARNIEEGGSLTIIATALIDTGSRLDQVVFEEFKGTGNMELVLNRDLANRRIFPAIDLVQSGTRKEELLLQPDVLRRVWILRKLLIEMPDPGAALEFIKSKMEQTRTNKQFLELMNSE